MDAIKLLKQDHKKVKDLMKQVEKTTIKAKKTREKLFTEIKNELEIHTKQEEVHFYPILKDYDEVRSLIFEAYEEHAVVDDLLAKISKTEPTAEEWIARFSVLKENVEHHIKEEEQELFPKVRELLDRKTLQQIGESMLLLKEEKKNGGFWF